MTRRAHLRCCEGKKQRQRNLCVHPRNVLEISIFYARLPHNIQLWLSAKSPTFRARKTSDILLYSIFNPQKKKNGKKKKWEKGKSALEIIKKRNWEIRKKIAICHAFQSLQQQICVYGFFSYMLDGSPMLLHWTLCSSEMARKKQQHKKKRKKWKNLYRNVGWLGEISLHASRAFSDYVLSLHRHISWGRFAFNIWITRRVVVEREWNERRYIWDIHKAKLWIWC